MRPSFRNIGDFNSISESMSSNEMPTTVCDVPNLVDALQRLLEQIPAGRVATYGDLAAALGSRTAARWIGEYLLDHPHTERCICHRVVRSTGEPGLYISSDARQKLRRLKQEGVCVSEGRVDLDRFRFDSFQSEQPLRRLVEWQNEIALRVSLEPLAQLPRLVAGVDVSYVRRDEAVGAYALVESSSGRLVWSTTRRAAVTFPYIPGMLAFREIPVLVQLLERADQAGRMADFVLVDGNGLLHPRRAGLATVFGVLTDRPTIGVGKKLLCGQVDLEGMGADDARDVIHEGRPAGTAVKAGQRFRPVFVSPGQHVDVSGSRQIVKHLFRGHRLPEPIYWADRLSRDEARKT